VLTLQYRTYDTPGPSRISLMLNDCVSSRLLSTMHIRGNHGKGSHCRDVQKKSRRAAPLFLLALLNPGFTNNLCSPITTLRFWSFQILMAFLHHWHSSLPPVLHSTLLLAMSLAMVALSEWEGDEEAYLLLKDRQQLIRKSGPLGIDVNPRVKYLFRAFSSPWLHPHHPSVRVLTHFHFD
jgi:hypothetical protein